VPDFASATVLSIVAGAFLLAGFVKGLAGMGLPSVAMGLMTLTLAPAQAASILLFPALFTNIWQLFAGPALVALIRRFASMMIGICVGTWLGFGVMTGDSAGLAAFGLGAVLMLSSGLNLAAVRFSVPRRLEGWLSPLVGLTTGLVTGATGAFIFPAVPYMAALEMDKEQLVQALSLSATVSTFALGSALAFQGSLGMPVAGLSLLAMVPAFIGMFAGQRLRLRVGEAMFRRIFQAALLLLGLYLAIRNFP
jgi:uncharacterized membrane protein YfcA